MQAIQSHLDQCDDSRPAASNAMTKSSEKVFIMTD